MSLKAYYKQNVIEAGCDEAGRGCLAGPVFAAAVVLPGEFDHPLLNDSKMLSGKKRYLLRKDIEKYAVAWSVAQVNNTEIDEINILRASFMAMHKAIAALKVQPEHLIIDGNRFHPFDSIPHTCIIKGDSRYQSIAAASILAKTYRDDFMISIHEEFPHFNWKANKGYPTKEHREGILEHGISPYHRRSFSLINTQLKCWNE